MNSYLNGRVLKINVGFLLADGPAHNQDSTFELPAVRLSDDLILQYVRGPIRLSRTHEGILVQADLHVGMPSECIRCLDALVYDAHLHVEELFEFHSSIGAEFSIGDDANLDLAPLLRAEAFIDASRGVLCRPDCKGLCPECGTNLNHETCNCADNRIDPRFEKLKALKESLEPKE